MTLSEALLLGLIQGLAEWLPVSSEGIVTATYSLAFGAPLPDALNFSLWLHLGSIPSAIAAFRSDIWRLLQEIAKRPAHPSPITAYLILATLVSAPVGLLLLAGILEFSERLGTAAMIAVGTLMLATGALLLRSGAGGKRARQDLKWPDAVLTGIAQGLAALPGLSRSGLTISALLWRGVDKREALTLSFLLSVPANAAAGLYAALTSDYYASPQAAAALALSALVGFATIKSLIALAQKINFGWFVLLIGAGIAASALWALWTL